MSRLIIADLNPCNPTLCSISASEADRIVGGWWGSSSYNFGQTNSGYAPNGTITVGQNVYGSASSPTSYSSASVSGSATGQNVYMSSSVSGSISRRRWY